MKADVYRFFIGYEGSEDKIWRLVDVSSNYSLAKFGYLILSSFDTLAYHLFMFDCDKKNYQVDPDPDFDENSIDASLVKLSLLKLREEVQFKMIYDFGCDQTFIIKLMEIREMEKGQSTKYPCIIDGAGKGILDDVPTSEFEKIVRKIDKIGKSEHYYFSPYGKEELWDYREFNLDEANRILKCDIAKIQMGFEG